MLRHHISGLPVIDETGRLISMILEGDFVRRDEIGTQRPRIKWLEFLMGAIGNVAQDYASPLILRLALSDMKLSGEVT